MVLHYTGVSLGSRIRECRKELKLTQDELAKKVGCNRVSVTNWERNRNEPDRDSFLALLGAFNVLQKWLMKGELPKRSIEGLEKAPYADRLIKIASDGDLKEPVTTYALATDIARNLSNAILDASARSELDDEKCKAIALLLNIKLYRLTTASKKGGNSLRERPQGKNEK